MDIDAFYRGIGRTIKRAWNAFVKRPVKNYNVEQRTFKVIEKKHRDPAPWHETTKNVVERLKKESDFDQINKLDIDLIKRLNEVKVVSKGDNPIGEEQKRKLPQDRFGLEMPYTIYRYKAPPGKITVYEMLDVLLNIKKSITTVNKVSSQYSIPNDDLEKIVHYVGVFKQFNQENNQEVQLYTQQEDEGEVEARELLDATNSEKKEPKKLLNE